MRLTIHLVSHQYRIEADMRHPGKNQANALWDKGARTIADLSQDGNPYNLTSGQLTGLALYDDLNTRIPRAECKEIYEIVRDEAKRADKKVWIEIMGSYRRGSETSGDVDFLITRDTADGGSHRGVLRKLVGGLIKKGTITHEVSRLSSSAEASAQASLIDPG